LGEIFDDVRQFKGSDKGTEGFKLYRAATLLCKRKCISRQNNQPFPNLDGKVDPLTKNACTVYCRRASNGNKKTNRKFCEDKNFCRKPELPLLPKLAERRGYTTLVAALNAADLVETLEQEEPLRTLFAPTDEGFAKLPEGLVECLLEPENKDTLVEILTNHLVEGRYNYNSLQGASPLTSLAGFSLTIEPNDLDCADVDFGCADIVNFQTIVMRNRNAKNGILHGINGLLLPDNFDATAFLGQCGGGTTVAPTIAPTIANVPTPRPSRTKRPTTPRPTQGPISCDYQRDICYPCLAKGCYYQLAGCVSVNDEGIVVNDPDVSGCGNGSNYCRTCLDEVFGSNDKLKKKNCDAVCRGSGAALEGVNNCRARIDEDCPAPPTQAPTIQF